MRYMKLYWAEKGKEESLRGIAGMGEWEVLNEMEVGGVKDVYLELA